MAIANISGNILSDSGVATSSLLPLTGGTLTGALSGTSATFSSSVQATSLGMNVVPLSDRVLYLSGNLSTTGASQFQSVMNGTVVNAATTIYGMYVGNNSNVNVTNSYAIYIETTGGSGTITNKYGIYQASSGDKNYFAGNVGIGISPSYRLDVSSGASGVVLNLEGTNAYNAETGILMSSGRAKISGFLESSGGTPGSILRFYTMPNGGSVTERMTITSGGNVGIGATPTGSWRLYINSSADGMYISTSGANQTAQFANTGANNVIMRILNNNNNFYDLQNNISDNSFTIDYNDNERMRITSGGNVLLSSDKVLGINTSDGSDNGYLALVGAGADGETRGGLIYLSGNERSADAGTVVLQAGNVGNGTIKFRTGAGVERMLISGTGTVFIYSVYSQTSASAANVIVGSDGNLFRSTSSLKYKKDVVNYTKGLAEVMKLRPVTYKGKNEIDGNRQFAGLIAEEIHDLGLTEFVQYADDGTPDALAYQNMVALLTKAIQELKAQIEEQKADIESLKALINK